MREDTRQKSATDLATAEKAGFQSLRDREYVAPDKVYEFYDKLGDYRDITKVFDRSISEWAPSKEGQSAFDTILDDTRRLVETSPDGLAAVAHTYMKAAEEAFLTRYKDDYKPSDGFTSEQIARASWQRTPQGTVGERLMRVLEAWDAILRREAKPTEDVLKNQADLIRTELREFDKALKHPDFTATAPATSGSSRSAAWPP